MAYTSETYLEEYKTVFEDLLEQATISTTTGKDSLMEKLFLEIDAAVTDEEITVRDALSLKKDAYMQMLTALTGQSQKTAITLVDKKYKFGGEISLQDEQIAGSEADTAYKVASKLALEDQVTHNRLIKGLSSVANVNGMALGGGVAVESEQLEQFNDILYELVPEIV